MNSKKLYYIESQFPPGKMISFFIFCGGALISTFLIFLFEKAPPDEDVTGEQNLKVIVYFILALTNIALFVGFLLNLLFPSRKKFVVTDDYIEFPKNMLSIGRRRVMIDDISTVTAHPSGNAFFLISRSNTKYHIPSGAIPIEKREAFFSHLKSHGIKVDI